MVITLLVLLAIFVLLILFAIVCVLVAIPLAIAETILWVSVGLIILGLIVVIDFIFFPFKWLYRKMYPKKKEEAGSYY